MCIRHNCRLAKNIPHDQIRTFASHPRKLQKLLKGCRDIVIVVLVKNPHACTDVPCFAPAKATRTDDRLNLLRFCLCQRCHIRILCIKILHNHIHSCIRTLGSQSHTHKQFPCLVIVQRTSCIRIFFLKSVDHFQCQFFLCHFSHLSLKSTENTVAGISKTRTDICVIIQLTV